MNKLSWPLLWCCVFSPCVGHTPFLSLCFACHSTAHTWPASKHQLPFKYIWFPCSHRQIVLRYTVVVIRSWLQYKLSSSSLVEISCLTFFLFVYSLWTYTSSLPDSLPPAWCAPLSNLPPASILVTPNKPVHLHYNSCTVSVFCSWVQQLSLP